MRWNREYGLDSVESTQFKQRIWNSTDRHKHRAAAVNKLHDKHVRSQQTVKWNGRAERHLLVSEKSTHTFKHTTTGTHENYSRS